LFINVTAGIGILAQASPMVQDLFSKTATEAAFIVSVISIFNAGGRFIWASSSDYIGRRTTYTMFFTVQFCLFLLIPRLAASAIGLSFCQAFSSYSQCTAADSLPSRRFLPISSDRKM